MSIKPHDLESHRPLLLLLVRLMGLYLAINGLLSLIATAIDLWQQLLVARKLDAPVSGYTLGWTIASGLTLAAGLLLLFRSRIAMDAIFHERLDDLSPPRDGTDPS